MPFGTLSLSDLQLVTDQTILNFGEDRLFNNLQFLLSLHNEFVDEMMSELVTRTTDRVRRYGVSSTINMEPVDGVGQVDAQKEMPTGVNVAFPLRRFQIATQWTREWFKYHTVAELANQVKQRQDADIRRVLYELKTALFNPTNYTTLDRLYDNYSLDVKRLVNADSAAILPAPDGSTFNGASHTHYIARVSTLAASDITAVLNLVSEHYDTGQLILFINKASEAAVRAFTSNFYPYLDVRLTPADNTTRAMGKSLEVMNPYNRPIGLFDAAEVWVKPWMPANYMFAFIRGVTPPLVMREQAVGDRGFGMRWEYDSAPLHAEQFSRDFGFGVWERTNGAVLYTGGTSYVAPTLTA